MSKTITESLLLQLLAEAKIQTVILQKIGENTSTNTAIKTETKTKS